MVSHVSFPRRGLTGLPPCSSVIGKLMTLDRTAEPAARPGVSPGRPWPGPGWPGSGPTACGAGPPGPAGAAGQARWPDRAPLRRKICRGEPGPGRREVASLGSGQACGGAMGRGGLQESVLRLAQSCDRAGRARPGR